MSSVKQVLVPAPGGSLGASLFLTRFPCIEDMKLIIASGISEVYFFGPIDDKESVQLLNCYPEGFKPLEIIRLET